MNLLQTLLLYFSLLFMSAVDYAPQASIAPYIPTPEPTQVLQVVSTPTLAPRPTPAVMLDITPNSEYKTLKNGDSGDLVRELQEKLRYYGYYEDEIDGRYGNKTRYAVERFQFAHGLSADGIAGKRTLTALYESDAIVFANAENETAPQATPNIQRVSAAEPTVSPTPASTPQPTFIPLQTAAPAPTPVQTPTSQPSTAEPVSKQTTASAPISLDMLQQLDGFEVTADSALPYTCDLEVLRSLRLYRSDDSVYIPLNDLLRAFNMNTIRNETIEFSELAFAGNQQVVRINCVYNRDEVPESVSVYLDKDALDITQLSFAFGNQQLYISDSLLDEVLQLQITVDETEKNVVFAPAAPQDTSSVSLD